MKIFPVITNFIFVLVFFLLGLNSSCGAIQRRHISMPLNWQCPTRHIKVAYDSKFSAHHRELIENSLFILKNFRIQTTIVQDHPNVTIRFWRGFNCEDNRLGQYHDGTNYVELAPACFHTDRQFEVGVVHELGHWLGMRHICDPYDHAPRHQCVPDISGMAVMNPTIGWLHILQPSTLDIAEYNQACYNSMF